MIGLLIFAHVLGADAWPPVLAALIAGSLPILAAALERRSRLEALDKQVGELERRVVDLEHMRRFR